MRERPILFSGEMVRAILDGRKTQTRRVVRRQPSLDPRSHDYAVKAMVGCAADLPGKPFGVSFVGDRGLSEHQLGPYGQPGDRLWVRETWSADFEWPLDEHRDILPWEKMPAAFRSPQAASSVYYAADRVECHPPMNGLCVTPHEVQPTAAEWDALRWKPSIHMPRWASRLTLEVTGVRVERLQQISEEDAIAEGAVPSDATMIFRDHERVPAMEGTPRGAFACLWDDINAKSGHGWDANPWVWVVEFRRITPGVKP